MEILKNKIIINEQTFIKYIDKKTIRKAVTKIANKLNRDYKNKCPVFVIVLNGAVFFGTDLLELFKYDCRIETYRVKSYGLNMTGEKNIVLQNPEFNIQGKDILIIEDIIDTGNTLVKIIELFSKLEPTSLEIISLLIKKESIKHKLNVKYIGINIPSKFAVGYGLDYAEQGRHLQDIYILEK